MSTTNESPSSEPSDTPDDAVEAIEPAPDTPRRNAGLSPIALGAIAAIIAVVGLGVAVLLALGTADDDADQTAVDVQDMLNQQAAGGYAPPDGRRTEVGKSAPAIPLEFFDGSTGNLAQFTGRPLVINVWSSTCVPCLKEMPAFQAVSQRRADVQFLGVDYVDRPEDARRMLEQTGVTYLQATDPTGEVGQALGAPNLPYTVFIDDQGVVKKLKSGALDEAQLDAALTEAFG